MSRVVGSARAFLNRSRPKATPPLSASLTAAELEAPCRAPDCSNPVDRSGPGGTKRLYCSKACQRRTNRPPASSGLEGGGKGHYSQTATISYRGELSSAEGIASTKAAAGRAAIANAAGALGAEPGDVDVLSVSSPDSIFRDLQRSAAGLELEADVDDERLSA